MRRRPASAYAWVMDWPPEHAPTRIDDSRHAISETRAILLFANAQILDLLTTLLGLRSGLSEANPLASSFLGRSQQFAFSLKLLVGLAVLLAVYRYVSPRNRSRTLRLTAGIALTAALANALQLLLAV